MAMSLKKEGVKVKDLGELDSIQPEPYPEDSGADITEEALEKWQPEQEQTQQVEVDGDISLINPLQIILDVLQTLITKVEGLSDITEKEKAIGKLKGALEILSKSCN